MSWAANSTAGPSSSTTTSEETGIDPEFYATRDHSLEEILPWDHIDCGVSKSFLLREWDKAKRGELTHDCRKGCVGCGVMRYEGACKQ